MPFVAFCSLFFYQMETGERSLYDGIDRMQKANFGEKLDGRGGT